MTAAEIREAARGLFDDLTRAARFSGSTSPLTIAEGISLAGLVEALAGCVEAPSLRDAIRAQFPAVAEDRAVAEDARWLARAIERDRPAWMV